MCVIHGVEKPSDTIYERFNYKNHCTFPGLTENKTRVKYDPHSIFLMIEYMALNLVQRPMRDYAGSDMDDATLLTVGLDAPMDVGTQFTMTPPYSFLL